MGTWKSGEVLGPFQPQKRSDVGTAEEREKSAGGHSEWPSRGGRLPGSGWMRCKGRKEGRGGMGG